MRSFRKTLEDKAELISDVPKNEQWNKMIPSMLRRQIALTAEQIKRLRGRHDKQFRQLLRLECYVNTDLLQLKQGIPRYTPQNGPENETLKQRLFDIEKQRRALSLNLEEKTQTLEDKLLSLINKHEQLDI